MLDILHYTRSLSLQDPDKIYQPSGFMNVSYERNIYHEKTINECIHDALNHPDTMKKGFKFHRDFDNLVKNQMLVNVIY